MKKTIGIMIAAGIILAVLGVSSKINEAASISVIGGADGPTAIFIAGKIGDGFILGVIFAIILLAAAGVVIYKKIKKKQM